MEKLNKLYNVTCGTDDKYAQHCLAMLCSLFESNKSKKIVVHILINKLSDSYKVDLNRLANSYGNQIVFHVVDDAPFEGVQFKSKRPLTKAAYYRLKLPSILSDIHTVLYLDCDMIILGDIDELFDIDLTGYALAACRDSMPYTNLHRRQLNHPVGTKTFCSGIMYINLDYWRNVNSEPVCLEFARKKRNPVYLHDQDVFNFVFKNQWFMLPPKWNVSPNAGVMIDSDYCDFDYSDSETHPCVYHYFDKIKPWQDRFCFKKKLYLKYLEMSGCSNPYIEPKSFAEKIEAYSHALSVIYTFKIESVLPLSVKILIHDLKWLIQFPIYLVKVFFFPKGDRWKQIDFLKNNRL